MFLSPSPRVFLEATSKSKPPDPIGEFLINHTSALQQQNLISVSYALVLSKHIQIAVV